MDFWENVKKDLEKAWGEGIAAVKDGSRFAARKVDQLTQEGKKRYKVFDLKTDIHREIGELGGLIYGLKDSEKNPLEDRRVKARIKKIDKLQARVAKLEGPGAVKKPKRKTVRKKTRTKKTAVKQSS